MNKLALVGSGTQTRELAPFDDESYDIWVMNEAAQSPWCKRWSACFQMHKPEIYTGHNTKNAKHWEWLQESHGKPIYMQAPDERVPDCTVYPLAAAQALVGVKYLTSTPAYAFALAHLKGYKQVDVYGIEMSATEYQYQAECYRFWVGFLKGAGVTVNLYSSAHLFDALLYGYEGNFAFGKEWFEKRATALEREWNIAESNLKAIVREVQRALEQEKTLQLEGAVTRLHEAAATSGEKAGALAEAQRYAGFGDRGADRGGFEYAAAKAQREGEERRMEFLKTTGTVEYLGNVWMQTKNRKVAEQLVTFLQIMQKQAYDTGAMHGMWIENVDYLKKYDAMMLALNGSQPPNGNGNGKV